MLTQLGIVQRNLSMNMYTSWGGYLLPNPGNHSWDAVGQDCSVPTHQEDRELREGPPDLLTLLPTSMPRLGCGQLLHLLHCHLVPATQGLSHDWDELDPLLQALLIGAS